MIEQAAALLVQHGSPYALTAQQGGPGFLRYDPYLPAMTIFGLPHALAGGAGYYDDTDQASGAGYGGDAGDPADAPVPQRARAGGRATVTLTS